MKKTPAGKIVGEAAKIVGGGGGGRPHMATAGGKDISKEFDGIRECAVYCVTEVHTKEMLDEFLSALEDILRSV